MGRIIGVVNQKGGVGKTTIAVHLAYWLSNHSSVNVIDSDVQQSSSTWLTELNLPCQVCNDPEDLFDLIEQVANKYETVVIDGPAGLSEITKTILSLSDVALIPCKPSGLDTHSSTRILRMLGQTQKIRNGKPYAALVLNQAVKGTVLLREARQLFGAGVVPLLNTTIYNRQIISDAPGQGLTVWQASSPAAKQAAKDFESLFKEALELCNHDETKILK